MASAREELARFKFLCANGRAEDVFHVVDIKLEAKKRAENAGPRPKTRFVMETDDPEMYSLFNALKDRWLTGRNKSIVLSIMAERWNVNEEYIDALCNEDAGEALGDA